MSTELEKSFAAAVKANRVPSHWLSTPVIAAEVPKIMSMKDLEAEQEMFTIRRTQLLAEMGHIEFYLETVRQRYNITREEVLSHHVSHSNPTGSFQSSSPSSRGRACGQPT